ncbi:hypothetical protein [Chitinimonas sp.]|uniref:hypothetical protein n=1 Tax=Chitinimonas sp. TaxID=1934313 RepID=UPI002F91D39D
MLQEATVAPVEATQTGVRSVQWGGVLAGTFGALAIQLLGVLCGLVVGLSVGQVGLDDAGVVILPLSVSLWQAFCTGVGVFIGSFLAVAIRPGLGRLQGVVHGFLVWATTTVLLALLSCTSASLFLGGVFHNASGFVSRANLLDAAPRSDSAGMQLDGMLKNAARELVLSTVNVQSAREWQIQIESGDREQAISYLVKVLGFPHSRAVVLVDQALILSGNPERASQQARQVAKRNLEVLNQTSKTMLAAVAASLLLGMLAGGAAAGVLPRRL